MPSSTRFLGVCVLFWIVAIIAMTSYGLGLSIAATVQVAFVSHVAGSYLILCTGHRQRVRN